MGGQKIYNRWPPKAGIGEVVKFGPFFSRHGWENFFVTFFTCHSPENFLKPFPLRNMDKKIPPPPPRGLHEVLLITILALSDTTE